MKGFNSLTAKYTIISLLLLLFFGILLYQSFLFSWRMNDVARKMNLAGRQRMLTLRMVFHLSLIIEMKPSHDKDILIHKAESSMAEYEEALYGIRDGSKKLGLEPHTTKDRESLSRINELITYWEETQKPAVRSLMELPAERKNESCGICHSAVRTEYAMVEELVSSLEKYYNNIMRKFGVFRIYIFGFFLVMSLFMFLYVKKSLVLPVIRLRDAISEFKKGNFSIRTDIRRRDEIGELAEGFNQMAQSINATFEEKKGLMEGLEEKVKERTIRLEEARVMAEAANHAKSDFLANMSHELRTPLNGVIGFSEFMIDEKPGPLNAKQKEYLGDILTSGKHLLQLINDVLDLAKVEAGKMELMPEEFSLKKAIGEVASVVGPTINKKGLEFRVQVEPGAESMRSDQQKLKQILYNLLSNAVKFTDERGKVEITARACETQMIRIDVKDTGIGIRQEHMGKLFVEFQQIDTGVDRRYQGTGLGLALTKRIVTLLKGRIEVESEPGKGSTFSVILPRTL